MKLNYPIAAAILAGGTVLFLLGRMSSHSGGHGNGVTSADESRASSNTAATASTSMDVRSTSGPKRVKATRTTGASGRMDDLAGILRQGNPLERNRAFLKWMDGLNPSQIPEAIGQLRSMGLTDSRRGEYALLLSFWAAQDPTAAMADVMARGNSQRSVEIILDTWARNDPEAAIAWARTAQADDPENLAMVLGRLVSSDPARVNELLSTLSPGKPQDEAISEILRNSLIEGPQAARDWIGSIPDPTLQGNAIVQVAGDMAKIDPVGTAAWLKGLSGPAAQDGTFHLMAEWQQKDAAAAAAYFEAMPAGITRGRALGGIVASLSRDNPSAAAALMEQYPGDASETVISEFVNGAARSDPAFAVNYVQRISDPARQNAALDRVLSRWMRRDRAAAMAWAQSNPVPADIQHNLGLGR